MTTCRCRTAALRPYPARALCDRPWPRAGLPPRAQASPMVSFSVSWTCSPPYSPCVLGARRTPPLGLHP